MPKPTPKPLQNTLRNNSGTDLVMVNQKIDSLAAWVAAYFQFEVTTMASSQKVQKRDLATFLNFVLTEVRSDQLVNWTPRLSQVFKTFLQQKTTADGRSVLPADLRQLLLHFPFQFRVLVFSEWLIEGDLEGTIKLARHSLE